MMLFKLAVKDLMRHKIVTFGILLFLTISTLLAGGAVRILAELSGSLNRLLEAADTPHFVQMHSGDVDEGQIRAFSDANPLVAKHQTAEMLVIDGSQIRLGQGGKPETGGVMDLGLVKQNPLFDFLLDKDNRPVEVQEGEIAVPIYYLQKNNLEVGDEVRLTGHSYSRTLRIAGLVRDVQMNPAIVSSKRFVVSDRDYEAMKSARLGQSEFLIEFQLTDPSRLNEFQRSYESAGLPARGPSVDYGLFRMLNSLTDGLIAGVIIVVSGLLLLVALLCLRFTVIAKLEEEAAEIGMLKAIGLPSGDLRRLYLTKYAVIAWAASILGYTALLGAGSMFTANIGLYLGSVSPSRAGYLYPALAAIAVFGITTGMCSRFLRRLGRISPYAALRNEAGGTSVKAGRMPVLARSRRLPINLLIGFKELAGQLRLYGLLVSVFAVCFFIMVVPLNLLHTLKSPNFITYMGVGKSDLRIDLPASEEGGNKFRELVAALRSDPEIRKYSPLVTSRFLVQDAGEERVSLQVETGDFSLFPLSYTRGQAPSAEGEIALSELNAEELKKQPGDTLHMLVNGSGRDLRVSGVYQDITNGGRTAKAIVPPNPDTLLWYTVALDIQPGIDAAAKADRYEARFSPAKVTPIDHYLNQTLGGTINQLHTVTLLAIAVSGTVAGLLTALFVSMRLTGEASRIAVLSCIGFSKRDIRAQYLTALLAAVFTGILLGMLAAGTIGRGLLQAAGGMMGASAVRLEIQPGVAYILIPCLFAAIGVAATLLNTKTADGTAAARRIAA
ncbi:ABC transporter permease [Paenibacillus sp. CN-4]|uniref:ABC transporter permease n=1 Tax=Paenibacillus nanchangensis TaxID=3348343 RepID=UPI00397CC95B